MIRWINSIHNYNSQFILRTKWSIFQCFRWIPSFNANFRIMSHHLNPTRFWQHGEFQASFVQILRHLRILK